MGVVLGIVPVEFYASKQFSVEVLSDRVVVGGDCVEVVKVVVTHILDAKIVDNEDKHNGRHLWFQRLVVVVGL